MHNVIIIGAGPTGLSIAYNLKKYNINYLILEQESVGNTWRKQYDSLNLNTHKSISSINKFKINKELPPFLTALQFAKYLLDFKTKNNITVIDNTKVLSAAFNQISKKWEIETNQGAYNCNILVTATGIWGNPYMPNIEGVETFNGNLIHSSLYKNHYPFVNKKVLVVGSGNSAVDIAVDLAKNNIDVSMSIRYGVNLYPRINSAFLSKIFVFLYRSYCYKYILKYFVYFDYRKYYCKGLPKHPKARTDPGYNSHFGLEIINYVKKGKIKIMKTVTEIQNSNVLFNDTSKETFDSLIFATGFKANLSYLPSGLKKVETKSWEFYSSLNLFCVASNFTTNIFDLQNICKRVSKKIIQTIYK